ncbi:MAG: cation diffusion facilitator family transporter [Treponema sp.]|jgi:cation diffusion facilitator family transporter|nr:cation diffusion facilitator family transporter [Treponema sp.]
MSECHAEKARNKAGIIKAASITALAGNTLLAAVKLRAGFGAGSRAVVGDGIDSSVDVLIAVMSLAVAQVISRPADREHPWGHGRAETVATVLLSCILFFAGAQLMLDSGRDLLRGVPRGVPEAPALFATVLSIAGKILLAASQYFFGKKADSAMLKANARNMAADVVVSAAVLLGLGLSMLTGIGAVDSGTAILVGLWVISSAVGIFAEVNLELMDGSSGAESYRAVFDAVHSVAGAGNPHRTRMRRIAGLWDIDIDIEVDPKLTVWDAHIIACQVERAIKDRVEGVYDIMVHVEPLGDSQGQQNEGYGLSEARINGPSRRL